MANRSIQEGEAIGQPDVPVFSLPPAIIAHGGPGLLVVGFFVA